MRTIVGLLPWAIALAVIAGALWWMLSRDMAAGRWLLAAVLVGHAVVHLMFALPAPAASAAGPAWPFDMGRSWAVSAGLDLALTRAIGLALIAVVVAGFAIAALSTVGIVVPADWWPASVGVAAVASAVMLLLFFEPQLVLGPGIDAVLIAAVATRAWAP